MTAPLPALAGVLVLMTSVTMAAPAVAEAPQASLVTGGDLSGVLGGSSTGFARATGPRAFEFPADHAAHPDYRVEWWYFTGNVDSDAGRPFGFQLTFFRFALEAGTSVGDSAWASPQVWMGHFAVSDIAGERFHHFERFSRQGPGLAGAQAPFDVWLEDWSARAVGGEAFPLELNATAADVRLHLRLQAGKPLVLQGEQGLSRKSAEPGNASYYYSRTRMPARGSIEIDGERHAVAGSAWLDREWSTSALADQQVGWDWFSLQFDDGRDLMFYRLRLRDGGSDPASAGVLVAVDGASTPLAAADVTLDVLEWWTAADGAARYPARFRLRVSRLGLDIDVVPRLAAQEFGGRFRYWEGAVATSGSAAGKAVTGRGYLEMTGYAGAVGAPP